MFVDIDIKLKINTFTTPPNRFENGLNFENLLCTVGQCLMSLNRAIRVKTLICLHNLLPCFLGQ